MGLVIRWDCIATDGAHPVEIAGFEFRGPRSLRVRAS